MIALCGLSAMTACDGGSKEKDDDGLAAPTNLQYKSVTDTGATLTWGGSAEGYNIQITSTGYSETYSESSNSYDVTGLTAGTTYTWKVQAKSGFDLSEWTDGPSFTTTGGGSSRPDPDPTKFSVSVDFGNNTEKWSAALAYGEEYDNSTVQLVFFKYAEEDEPYAPMINACVKISGTTTFVDGEDSSKTAYWDYWSESYDSRETYEEEDGKTYSYGDWWVDSGTVTITSYTDDYLLSGTATLTLFDAYAWQMQNNDNPATKTLSVTFTDVPVYLPEDDDAASKSQKHRIPTYTHTIKGYRTR